MESKEKSITLTANAKYSICTCGKSSKLPLCDNSHRELNEKTGSNNKSLKIIPKKDIIQMTNKITTKTALKQLKQIDKLKGNMRLAAQGWKNQFQILISIILSARSLDETTIKVCKILFKTYPNSKSLSKANLKEIEKIVRPINFYKNKSRNIINCSIELEKKYKGKVPLDFNKLIELPGVGGKTANVFLSEQGINAIGVDTHVNYISNYLNWTKEEKPEKVEEDLKKLFPKSKWIKINETLVKFGKKYTSRKEKDLLLEKIKKIN